MTLDHTIVPCSNSKERSEFYATILGLEYCGEYSHFEVVKAGPELKLLFDTRTNFESHHYAFRANPDEYSAILKRIKRRNLPYGGSPGNRTNSEEYEHDGEKGFYFDDIDGHVLEVITETQDQTASTE